MVGNLVSLLNTPFTPLIMKLVIIESDDPSDNEEGSDAPHPPFEPDFNWEQYEGDNEDLGRIRGLLRGGEFGTFAFQNVTGARLNLLDKKDSYWKSPLFPGSKCTVSEYSKALLFLRQKFHRQMGDELMAGITGLVASCLPEPNMFDAYSEECCGGSHSKYHLNKLVFESSGLAGEKALISGRVDICENGCFPFCGESADMFMCPVCSTPRFRKCTPSCVDPDTGFLDCDHPRIGRRNTYYNTIRDRVMLLLDYDLGRLFSYPYDRRPCEDGYVDDVYDGTAWKNLQANLDADEELIGIQMCTDGADMYNFSGKNFYLFCLNSPHSDSIRLILTQFDSI
jgi:hypothetical protein